jgi:osmotically-inducible protein OsmY
MQFSTETRQHGLLPAAWLSLISAVCIVLVLGIPVAGISEVRDVPDMSITNAVEAALQRDDGVSSHLIDVKTNNGILTLSGSVDNILSRDRAVTIARATKGVRSVVDRLEVTPVERTDSEIRKDVREALSQDPAADAYEIDVTVNGGVVTLSGRVDSWAERRLGETIAKGVLGVRKVDNNIVVKAPVKRSDNEIKADVERQLEIDALINANRINVAVNNGKVKLTGTLGSAAEIDRALSKAWVLGVKSVQGDFDVDWTAGNRMRRTGGGPNLSNEEIVKAVKDAFFYDPRVRSFNPIVTVDDGVVTLSGRVRNLAAKRAAADTAMNTVGVRRVINLLRVRPLNRPSDQELAARVRAALLRDPWVERRDISVSVFNGKAYLYGTVDSNLEKNHAESVASNVRGIIDVQNNLVSRSQLTRRNDREIKEDIESELWWSPFVDSDTISVTVHKGEATLTGSVGTWFEWKAAEENALEGGARTVWNNLKIRQEPFR